MFLKSKIGLTILSIYEIIAILLLHSPRTCTAMFGTTFCADGLLKYFIVCVAVPLLVFLFAFWIMEIIAMHRRHHSLLYKAKRVVKRMASNIRDRVSENISTDDLEKLVSGALLVGLKKYSDRNPRARHVLDEIKNADIDVEYDAYYDEEDTPADYDSASDKSSKNRSQNKKQKKK